MIESNPEPFEVPVTELVAVRNVILPNVAPDERVSIGHVRLSLHEGHRVWDAVGDQWVVRLLGGPHPHDDLDVLVSPRLFPPPGEWNAILPWTDEQGTEGPVTTMCVPARRPNGSVTGPAELRAGPVRMMQPCGTGDFPDLDEMYDRWTHEEFAVIDVDPTGLRIAARRAAGSQPDGVEIGADYPAPPCRISIEGDEAVVKVEWPGFGPTEMRVEGRGGNGSARVAVHPGSLVELLDTVANADWIQLAIPLSPEVPIVLKGSDSWAALMPRRDQYTDHELLQHLRDLFDDLGLPNVEQDADGDFPLPFEDEQLFVRVATGDPPVGQVFAVIADIDQLESGDGLTDRINDTNTALRHARLFAVGGQVLLEADLTDFPGVSDLRWAARHVASQASLVRGLFPQRAPDAGAE